MFEQCSLSVKLCLEMCVGGAGKAEGSLNSVTVIFACLGLTCTDLISRSTFSRGEGVVNNP